MITNEQVISIGKLTRTHGKRGEVQCLMSNEYWDNADATFLILSINNILVPFRVLDWRGKGSDSLIFQLDRINDEQSAQQLVGCQAYMLLSDINEDDELLPTWQSLVGYSVLDTKANSAQSQMWMRLLSTHLSHSTTRNSFHCTKILSLIYNKKRNK